MKFQRIIQAVYFEPWSITMEGWMAVHNILKPHLDGKPAPELRSESETEDFYGNPLPKMEITPGGVAIIPIIGTLINHASLLDRMCGACGYDDIRRDIKTALGTDGLTKIVYHFDTPGGMCMGCEDTASEIAKAAEMFPSEAVSDGVIASAGYHLASACEKILCTSTAIIGSVGTFAAFLDRRIQFEMLGLKMDVLKSGDVKGAGIPGTSFTDAQRKDIQSQLDKYGELFRSRVLARRNMIPEELLQGQAYVGDDAAQNFFVDEIIDDIESCFEPPAQDDSFERTYRRS